MCRATKCKICNKTTWAGCGNHIDSVMRNVAESDKCKCQRDQSNKNSHGFLSKIFGK